jgi:two-component system NtrC family sensor kinase
MDERKADHGITPMIDHEAGRSRVLVIEDSKADQLVYRRTLHEFDLVFADSGEVGLDRLDHDRFDLVVLDYHLPLMNGDEVLARIRLALDPELPVVIVTGGGSENVAVDLLKRGASDYVTKDELHTPRVATAVRGALERHRLDLARRKAEDELRRQKDELQSALRKLQEAQAQLVQSEKMASLGQLVAGVAHEINNPLSYVTNNLAVLDRDIRQVSDLMGSYRDYFGDAVPESIREIEERIDLSYTLANLDRLLKSTKNGLQWVGEIVGGLRDFSRLDEATNKRVDPNEAVRATVEMVRFQFRQKGLELEVLTTPLPMIDCNPGQINQVLLNLIMNAIQAVDEGATITIRTRLVEDQNAIQYEIADTGPGIPESIRGKIFDPFFTTKPQGVGTGLGLWISYNIIEQHGGKIDLKTETGQGTTFTVTLPLDNADARPSLHD